MGIDVESKVRVYEVDGKETKLDKPIIKVLSHWNWTDRIVLEIDDKKYCVLEKDLLRAIENAKNK